MGDASRGSLGCGCGTGLPKRCPNGRYEQDHLIHIHTSIVEAIMSMLEASGRPGRTLEYQVRIASFRPQGDIQYEFCCAGWFVALLLVHCDSVRRSAARFL